FTIFENLSLNRDYVVFTLDGFENQLKALNIFSDFKNSFLAFIDEIGLDNSFINIDGLENIQKKTIKQSAWLQFLFIMKFWLNDTSDSFEKTDVLIEKSINTSFDLLDHSFLKSAIDLGKFLYKEQIQSH
ncbi:MAG: TetR/AcrR family transcriptional regulator, partial [Flavobacteriaceae bacterium]|nr:TetR/AcrR family transcriptional regulator [Flavobacteriaceae bacterium]